MKVKTTERALIIVILMVSDCGSFTNANTKSCDATSSVIMYNSTDLNSKKDVDSSWQIIRITRQKTYVLTFKRFTYLNESSDYWKNLKLISSKIGHIRITDSPIDMNNINMSMFNNLSELTVINTTTPILDRKWFQQNPNLRKLDLRDNFRLKSAERGVLQNLKIKFLRIQRTNLDEEQTKIFFGNLTGGSDIPSIQGLDWSHNQFGNFTKDLLQHYPNLKNLILTNSSITGFEEDVFKNKKLNAIRINRNKIRRISENVFKSVMENLSQFYVGGNELICDCQMEWLQSVAKQKNISGDLQNVTCSTSKKLFLDVKMCPSTEEEHLQVKGSCLSEQNERNTTTYRPILQNLKIRSNLRDESPRKFTVTEDDSDYIKINVHNATDVRKNVLWYINFSNLSYPIENCVKVLENELTLYVKPDTNYLICLLSKNTSRNNVLDCLPFKTKPQYKDQPWLTKKSISLSLVSIVVVVLLSMFLGAVVLYLSVRKNPSLIRGSKRVIEVKRHDKAQILIMPRGYEDSAENDEVSQSLTLVPSRSSDTLSTVSYVSAYQPTQLEILNYKLNRLREIFRNTTNEIPPSVPLLPVQISNRSPESSNQQRIPPNVDLLLEYEWYTITTTTTTTTTTQM